MRSIPAVKGALLLALGIFIGNRLPELNAFGLVGIAFLLVLLGLFGLRSQWGNVVIVCLVVLLGILFTNSDRASCNLKPEFLGKSLWISGGITAQPYRSQDRLVNIVKPAWISADGVVKARCADNLRLITSPDPRLIQGARVVLRAAIHFYPEQRNPGGRNWRQEFERQDIVGWVKPDTLTVVEFGKPNIAQQARAALSKILHQALPSRRADLLTGMVLGDKSIIPEDLHDDFKRSGLYHLLVVSGSNIGYLMATMTLLISPFSLSLRWRRVFLLAGIWMYVLVTGFGSPTVRAAIMISLLLLSFELQRVPRRWNLLGAAAFLILLFAPQQLFQPGFQLSFAAMAGILFASDVRHRKELARPPLPLKSRRLVRFLDCNVYMPFLASLCAVTFTAPILIYHFGGFAPSAILFNLLAIPLAGAIFALTWLLILFKMVFGLTIFVLNDGLEAGLKALEFLASAGAALPGNASGHYGGFWISVLVLAALIGLFLFKSWRSRMLWVGAALAFLLLFAWDHSRCLQIEFLDVGQGEATLLRFPDGKNLLVDCGDQDAARFELAPSLRRRGIYRIHALVISHFDKDHAAGAPEVMKSLRVDRLLANSLEPEDDLGRSIMATARRQQIPIQKLSLGDTLANFSGARCLVLWPPEALKGADNAESLVLRITLGDADVLLTGDIGLKEEMSLLAAGDYLQSEILKVPHHGSANSSSRAFLETVKPTYALIGCGAENRYGHPAARVLADLQALGSRIYRTDQNGAVILRSDGEGVWQVDWR